jgi:hypothetical protein
MGINNKTFSQRRSLRLYVTLLLLGQLLYISCTSWSPSWFGWCISLEIWEVAWDPDPPITRTCGSPVVGEKGVSAYG